MFDKSALESMPLTASGGSHPVRPTGATELRIGASIRPQTGGRVCVVLGKGFARDTVVVRIGGIEVGRRCGVTTLPSGIGGTIVAEMPVGADNARLEVEVVGRRLGAAIALAAPENGEATVEANLTGSQLELVSL